MLFNLSQRSIFAFLWMLLCIKAPFSKYFAMFVFSSGSSTSHSELLTFKLYYYWLYFSYSMAFIIWVWCSCWHSVAVYWLVFSVLLLAVELSWLSFLILGVSVCSPHVSLWLSLHPCLACMVFSFTSTVSLSLTSFSCVLLPWSFPSLVSM